MLTTVIAACYVWIVASSAAVAAFRFVTRDPRGSSQWRTQTFRSWCRAVARVLRLHRTIEGRPPAAPFFLVTNHLGYLDVITLGATLPCVFVAKAEVAGWPLVGRLCRAADTIFINRESKRDIPRVLSRVHEVLDSGRGVVVFPEGTSSAGEGVLRFRPSLLEAAATGGLPVSWATLHYSTPPGSPPAHLSVCWWGGGVPFASHLLGLLALPRIEATVSFGVEPVREADRKVLAARLQGEVERRFRPVVSVGDLTETR